MGYDVLVVGAGISGATAARALADRGKKILLLEKRKAPGGNCVDHTDGDGFLIHDYGPHIFHTDDFQVLKFLSRFTGWRRYEHRVLADIADGKGGRTRLPVPFNLDALIGAYGEDWGTRLAGKLLAAYPGKIQVPVLEMLKNPDPEIRRVGKYVYEHVFLYYTMKQWGKKPEEIDPATTGRVPVRLNADGRYFLDRYQRMPLGGYSAMFRKMLDHPNIETRYGEDGTRPALGARMPVIYTGSPCGLFDHKYGTLPYRAVQFELKTLDTDDFQGAATVNYTMDRDYTRSTEFRHLTGNGTPGKTAVLWEYPCAPGTGREACYPVRCPEADDVLAAYKALAAERGICLSGRLAEHRYYDMDDAAAAALKLAEKL